MVDAIIVARHINKYWSTDGLPSFRTNETPNRKTQIKNLQQNQIFNEPLTLFVLFSSHHSIPVPVVSRAYFASTVDQEY
jgi:hypothetical protein